MTWKTNQDGVGNVLIPGDICVRSLRGGKCIYCIFVGSVWGSKSSKGEYGKFLTSNGFSSFKLSNVLLAFDPISERRATIGISELTRKFYEQGK